MKISSREKGLIILLIIVALIVFLMPGEENISLTEKSNLSKTTINTLIAKYKYIKPFNFKSVKNYKGQSFTLKRNIFQYGAIVPDFNNQLQPKESIEEKLKNRIRKKQTYSNQRGK
ncbi:hypothetical protein TTHT_0915 [Thermotomaculum hydrothermale]|uniref:Uncharacterized protein n=1 Tax=Thermotomaculum hydrothermale TaxID=981385 RepID=A0A7R6PQG1_9BACT|nr:hypothetical protein [Thermotomaculum hydrothermale]BBB32471.1 hypothetical protein TTHT_0915 [Thermotomaculum hydrothermale]